MRKKKYTIILSILIVLESIFVLLIPYFTNHLVDNSLEGSKDNFILYSILLTVTAIISIFFHTLNNFLYSKFSLDLEENIKKELYDSMSKKKYSELSKYHSAEIELLFTKDTDNIIHKKLVIIPSLIRTIVRVLLAAILLVYIVKFDYKLLLILIALPSDEIILNPLFSIYILLSYIFLQFDLLENGK